MKESIKPVVHGGHKPPSFNYSRQYPQLPLIDERAHEGKAKVIDVDLGRAVGADGAGDGGLHLADAGVPARIPPGALHGRDEVDGDGRGLGVGDAAGEGARGAVRLHVIPEGPEVQAARDGAERLLEARASGPVADVELEGPGGRVGHAGG